MHNSLLLLQGVHGGGLYRWYRRGHKNFFPVGQSSAGFYHKRRRLSLASAPRLIVTGVHSAQAVISDRSAPQDWGGGGITTLVVISFDGRYSE